MTVPFFFHLKNIDRAEVVVVVDINFQESDYTKIELQSAVLGKRIRRFKKVNYLSVVIFVVEFGKSTTVHR